MNAGGSSQAGVVVLVGALLASFGLQACTSSEGASPSVDDLGSTPIGDGGTGTGTPKPADPGAESDGGEPPPPPCDTSQAPTIQAAFESADAAPIGINAVAIIRDRSCGERFFTRGPSQYQADVVHLVGSNTKTYVASLTLLLADDGVLSLDDSISKWIKGVPGGDVVTVRHLLNHTSGIADYGGSIPDMLIAMLGIGFSPQQLVNKAFSKPVLFAAGTAATYSNSNYILLGMIAEAATGKTLESLIRERILSRIGASATFFHGKEEIEGDVAVGRTFLGGNGASVAPSYYWAAGSYAATPSDLAKWVEARASGQFHSAQGNAELLKMVDTPIEGVTFGAGIMRFVAPALHLPPDVEALGHPGLIMGYYSYGMYYPRTKTTVVVIVDSDEGPKGPAPLNGFKSFLDPLYFSVADRLTGYTAP